MELETVKTVAMWSIIVIAALGILSAIIIRKIIGKVISLVLAAVLIFVGWQQRDKVVDFAEAKRAEACVNGKLVNDGSVSFLGISVELPENWCTKR